MTPEQEEQVRRALAGLTEAPADNPPLPADVAARLDATLTDLVADRFTEPATTIPATEHADELAARRRRGRPRVLLAAAAAVVVTAGGVVAVSQLAGRGGSSSDTSASSASRGRADSAQGGGSATSGRSFAQKGTRRPGPAASASAPRPGDASRVPALHRATLRRDVERMVVPVVAAPRTPAVSDCRPPRTTAGDQVVGVLLDGRPATLVLGPVAQGRQTARVYACTDPGAPVASTSVAAGG